MDSEIAKEQNIHGKFWADIHGGYFSDKIIAKPLLDIILNESLKVSPDVLIDLGGGTGFLLNELATMLSESIQLYNLDLSQAQLSCSESDGIKNISGSIDSFSRQTACGKDQKMMLIMRSVLHYFGEAGTNQILSQIASQMLSGELFINQTACTNTVAESILLNQLYRLMGTNKWFMSKDFLKKTLEKNGFFVLSMTSAPTLPVTSLDLAVRYNLDKSDISAICKEMKRTANGYKNIFTAGEEGFTAFLDYQIFVCEKK